MRPAKATATTICFLIPLAGLVFATQALPANDGALLAVYPPWWTAAQALAAAGGIGDIRNGSPRGVAYVVQSQSPDLAARLRASGAILVMKPLADDGCASSPGANNG